MSDPSMRGGLKNKAVFFSSKFVPFTITQGLLVRYNRLVLGYTVGVGITVATCSEKTKETRRFVLGLWLQFESPSSMFPNTVVRMWSTLLYNMACLLFRTQSTTYDTRTSEPVGWAGHACAQGVAQKTSDLSDSGTEHVVHHVASETEAVPVRARQDARWQRIR